MEVQTVEPGNTTRNATHTTGSRLIFNTLANVGGQVCVVLLTFWSTPYIAVKLGSVQYGALTLLMVYLFSFSLLNLGINTSLVKYLAACLPRREYEQMQQLVSTAMSFLVSVGVLAGIIVLFAAGPLVHTFFKDTAQHTASTILSLRIASVAFILQFLAQVLSSLIFAAQRFEILNGIRVGFEVVRIGGTVTILHLGGGVPHILVWLMFASSLLCIAYGVSSKIIVPQVKLCPGFSLPHFLQLFNHSKYVMITNVSNQIVSTADNMILGLFLPVVNQAYYGIAYGLAQRLWVLVGNVSSVVLPAASTFSSNKRIKDIRELYIRGTKAAAMAACFPAFALATFSKEFLLLWLSPEYANKAALVLTLLVLGFMLNAFCLVAFQVLQSTMHVRTAAKGSLAYMAINLGLFTMFIPSFGLPGAAAGFLVAQVIFLPFFVGKSNRLLSVRWGALIRRAYLPPVVLALLCSAGMWVLRPFIHSLCSLGLLVSLGLGVYLMMGYSFVLDDRERHSCRLLVRRFTEAFRAHKAQAANGVENGVEIR